MSAFSGSRYDTVRIYREETTNNDLGERVVQRRLIATVTASVEQAPRGVDDQRLRAGSDEERVEYIVTTWPLEVQICTRDRVYFTKRGEERAMYVTRVYEGERTLVLYCDDIMLPEPVSVVVD